MNAPISKTIEALLDLEAVGIKLGLDQIRALVEALGRPDLAFRSIIVAGTNGKGSVTAMVERGLRAARHRTGRFTSPHLVDLAERFVIDGQSISAAAMESSARRVLAAAESLPAPPSFFEATTALALDAFRHARVDVATLEVGLGGRLDATNVVDAMAAAITSVDFDHEAYLGDTLGGIALEKAGVIRPGAPVVLAENPPVVEQAIASAAAEAGATLVRAAADASTELRLVDGRARGTIHTPVRTYRNLVFSLAGRHQIQNALCAVRLLEEVSARGMVEVGEDAIRQAVEDVEWPGRLEALRVIGLDVIVDGAHNPAGARALAAFVAEAYGRRVPIVLGAMRDKNLEGIVAALAPAASCFVTTAPSTGRAARPDELAGVAARVAPDVRAMARPRPLDAVQTAGAFGSPVLVAGSLYLAGEIRAARA